MVLKTGTVKEPEKDPVPLHWSHYIVLQSRNRYRVVTS